MPNILRTRPGPLFIHSVNDPKTAYKWCLTNTTREIALLSTQNHFAGNFDSWLVAVQDGEAAKVLVLEESGMVTTHWDMFPEKACVLLVEGERVFYSLDNVLYSFQFRGGRVSVANSDLVTKLHGSNICVYCDKLFIYAYQMGHLIVSTRALPPRAVALAGDIEDGDKKLIIYHMDADAVWFSPGGSLRLFRNEKVVLADTFITCFEWPYAMSKDTLFFCTAEGVRRSRRRGDVTANMLLARDERGVSLHDARVGNWTRGELLDDDIFAEASADFEEKRKKLT